MIHNDVSTHEYDTVTFIDFPTKKKSNKKQSRRVKRQQDATAQQKGINIRRISPITDNQEKAFESFNYNKNMLLHGVAGTGKTFISLYLALKDTLDTRRGSQSVQIIRSVVPTRDMGFLPGNQKEKAKAYEEPYYSICNELFGRGDAYDILKQKKIIEFSTTSFIRGLTFNNTTVIVDECQNMSWHELDSVITRLGENSRIVFCGDFRQSDFRHNEDKSGIHDFMRVIKTMDSFDFVEFDQEDIVRSALVKEYIISKLELGMT
jgi:phosphate starvation-inducible protein PhoH